MTAAKHPRASPRAVRSRRPAPRSSLLVGLAKTAIEAALEAELVEHLGYERCDGSAPRRGTNTRNGVRFKTVGTVFGRLRISTPRDRWGSFSPLTVGKWQREVVGIDRLLLFLVAKGAPADATLAMLRKVYPAEAPDRTLVRIAATIQEQVAKWHERALAGTYPVLRVHHAGGLQVGGQLVGFPVVSVIGVLLAPDGGQTRELLAVQAGSAAEDDPLHAILRDLRSRGVVGVRHVACEASLALGDVDTIWPSATVGDTPPPAS